MKKILFIFIWLSFVPLCFATELVENLAIRVSYVEKDEQGRVKTWIEEGKDKDGIVISKRIDSYTYYSSGCVNTIILQVYDGDKLVSEKTIKHFEDIKQPIIEGGK